MAGSEKLGGTLQENLITLLCHSDENGRMVANFVDPTTFEGDYRIFAERAVDYWKRHGRAPGPHTADLVADIIEDKHDRRGINFRNILVSMLQLSETINSVYVISQLRTFTRMQKFKAAVLQSAARLASQQELAITEVEEMWADLLRTRDVALDPGLSLIEVGRLLNYMQSQYSEFSSGIPLLDRAGVVPARGTVILLLAPTGVGKTWGLIHLGKQGLMQRKRVLHLSLEMSEEENALRYYQSFFSVTRRETKGIKVATINKNRFGKLTGISSDVIRPEFTFDSTSIKEELEAHSRWMQGRFKNMLIKRFPNRGLTVNQLSAFLDNLETSEKFIPDMLLLDYIGIMNVDQNNYRIALGRTFEDLRGLAVERNIAVVTAQQISREGAKSIRSSATHVAEDWSLIGTADQAISISSTEAEKQLGLARLFVEKARNERDKFGVLITQNYDTGQFVLDSALLDEPKYMDMLDIFKEDNEEDRDVTQEDDDEG